MKHKRTVYMALLAALVCLVAACGDKENHISVNPSQVEGLWVKSGTEEYWRYNADYSGVTWDESDSIFEQESNLTYRWSLQQDVLTHVFSGAQGNQAVPKVYTITEISSSLMRWEDDYGLSYTLKKITEEGE